MPVEQITSPLDARLDQMREWWTPQRFNRAWNDCRRVYLGSRVALLLWVGTSLDGRTVSRWKRGESRPNWHYMARLHAIFCELLGADWMKER